MATGQTLNSRAYPPGVDALRDESLAQLRRAANESPEERSRILQVIQAAWQAMRRLINAILSALGLKRASTSEPKILNESDVTDAANAVKQRLSDADAQTASFQQALDFCGFDAMQQGLLRMIEKPDTLDGQLLTRLSSPVFATAAQRLRDLDSRLNRQRQELAMAAEPLVSVFGGPPLVVEDVVRISRGVDIDACPPEQAAAIKQVLRLDEMLRVGMAQRSVVADVAKNFASAGLKAGVDLAGLEDHVSQVLGTNWKDLISAEVGPDAAQALADDLLGDDEGDDRLGGSIVQAKPSSAFDRLRSLSASVESIEARSSSMDQAQKLATAAVQAAAESSARVQAKPSPFDRLRAISARNANDTDDGPTDRAPQGNAP